MFLDINMFMAQLMSYEKGQKHICFQEHQLYYTIITIIKAWTTAQNNSLDDKQLNNAASPAFFSLCCKLLILKWNIVLTNYEVLVWYEKSEFRLFKDKNCVVATHKVTDSLGR